jgi:phosphosulfolactate synthase (CoM biosynthesis protein A)
MKFNLDVSLIIDGIGNKLGGTFYAKSNRDVVKVAYDYVRSVKMETGMRHTVIEEVLVNGEHDITEDVINYREYDPEFDNLPF